MSSIPIQAVLLDMGGVILTMAGGHGFPFSRLDFRGRQALLQALTRTGGKARLEDLESLVFGPWHPAYERREEAGVEADWSPHLERLRSRRGGTAADLELLAAWFRPYGEQLLAMEGSRRALAELRDLGVRLALVSNVPLPGELYSRVLERHGLLEFFEARCFSYDEGSRKPSPALLRLAMTRIEADADFTLMVGDRRERDIAAGRFAGTGTVWIRSSDHGGPEPDLVLDSIRDLPDAVRRWRR